MPVSSRDGWKLKEKAIMSGLARGNLGLPEPLA